jgi:hypothetical protein
MLIKRLAIKEGVKFVRLDQRKYSCSVCSQCEDELPKEHCGLCRDVFYITGVNSYAISYDYYIPRT